MILFFPWSSDMQRSSKIATGIILYVVILVAIFGSDTSTDTKPVKGKAVAKQKTAKQKAFDNLPARVKLQKQIEQVVKPIDKHDFKTSAVDCTKQLSCTITYHAKSLIGFHDKEFIQESTGDTLKKVFDKTKAKQVDIFFEVKGIDGDGNEQYVGVYYIDYSKSNWDLVNWSNIKKYHAWDKIENRATMATDYNKL